MEILVCFKQVVEETEIRVDREGGRLIFEGVPTKISDDDKNAIEEAVRIKQKVGGTVTALTLGSTESRKQVREALAMGCDKAYLILDSESRSQDTYRTAKLLAEAVKKIGKFDLILCGSASTDNLAGQVGPMLAEILGLPQLTYVKKIDVSDGRVNVERSLEEETEVCEATCPVLITVTREINEPKVPTLMQVMAAGKKPLVEWQIKDVLAEVPATLEALRMEIPRITRKRIVFKEKPAEAAQKLAEAVKKEGVI
ncbi:MAG: electron transfer flavoprotein subunit beta/FixA family protein [Nitrososphaerales archaeon]